MSNWNQPICRRCYQKRHPGRDPVRIRPEFVKWEQCCDCGLLTIDGIFLRADARTVAYPKAEEMP